jgi:hypothetical protein
VRSGHYHTQDAFGVKLPVAGTTAAATPRLYETKSTLMAFPDFGGADFEGAAFGRSFLFGFQI